MSDDRPFHFSPADPYADALFKIVQLLDGTLRVHCHQAVTELSPALQADLLDEAVRQLQTQASAVRRGEGHELHRKGLGA